MSKFLNSLNNKGMSRQVRFVDSFNGFKLLSIESHINPDVAEEFFLFHYTNQNAAQSILQSKSIWASDPFFLNDEQEIQLGVRALKKVFNRLEEVDSETFAQCDLIDEAFFDSRGDIDNPSTGRAFTVSFSEKSDDLSQWRGYSNENGVALGFSFNLLTDVKPNALLLPVLYGTEDYFVDILWDDLQHTLVQFDRLDKPNMDVRMARNDMLIRRYKTFLPLMKNEAFQAEKEWRLILTDYDVSHSIAEWRPNGRYAVPYIILSLWRDGAQTRIITEQEPTAISYKGCKVIFGPGTHPLAKHFFQSLNIKFQNSSVPFRT